MTFNGPSALKLAVLLLDPGAHAMDAQVTAG